MTTPTNASCRSEPASGSSRPTRSRLWRLRRRRTTEVLDVLETRRHHGRTLAQHARRPEVTLREVLELADDDLEGDLSTEVLQAVEVELKYAPYIERQRLDVERFRRSEAQRIPEEFDYEPIVGLRGEVEGEAAKTATSIRR